MSNSSQSGNGYIGGIPIQLKQSPEYYELVLSIEDAIANQPVYLQINISIELRRLCRGLLTPDSEDMIRLQLSRPCRSYMLAISQVTDYSDMFFDNRTSFDNIDIAHLIFRTAVQYYARTKRSIAHAVTGFFAGRIVTLYSLTEASSALPDAQNAYQSAVDFMEQNYGLDFTVAMSDSFEKPAEIQAVYSQLLNRLNYTRMVHHATEDAGPEQIDAIMDKNAPIPTGGSFLRSLHQLSGILLAREYEKVPRTVKKIIRNDILPLQSSFPAASGRFEAVLALLSSAVYDSDPVLADRICSIRRVNTLITEIDDMFAAPPVEKDVLSKACDYIRENYTDQLLSVSSVGEAVGVSRQYLARLFDQSLNMSVSDYIHQCRIAQARRLLNDTDHGIQEIAEEVGYGNANSLSRNFRRYQGMLPSAFRGLRK